MFREARNQEAMNVCVCVLERYNMTTDNNEPDN